MLYKCKLLFYLLLKLKDHAKLCLIFWEPHPLASLPSTALSHFPALHLVISFNPHNSLPRRRGYNLFYYWNSERLSNCREVTELVTHHCFLLSFSYFIGITSLCHFFLDCCFMWVISFYCSNGQVWQLTFISSIVLIYEQTPLCVNVRY